MSPHQRDSSDTPDDRRPVAVGLILWLVATVFAATLAVIGRLPDGTLWTCIVGVVLGVAGLGYTSRHRTRL